MVKYYKFRENMVDSQIRTSDVRHQGVLEAFRNVKRELFVPEHLEGVCYLDEELDIGGSRFLLAPALQARLMQEGEPSTNDVVLDVGGGTGYSAALWSRLVSTVIALEENQELLNTATKLWQQLESYNIAPVYGRLEDGAQQYQPFDIVFLNGAICEPPEKLLGQLKEGGVLLTVMIESGRRNGCAVKFQKDTEGHITRSRLFDAACPYLHGFCKEKAFAL